MDPVSSEHGREQHTEVSLSVTSGGLPFVVEEPKRKRSPALAVGAGIALGAAVVALGVGLSLYAGQSHEVVKAGPAATGGSATPVVTPPSPPPVQQPAPPTALSALPTDDTSAMTIDQLPLDRPEAAGTPRVDDPRHPSAGAPRPRTAGTGGTHTRPAAPEEPAARPASPSVPSGGILRDLQGTSGAKAVKREDTWGRD